MSAWKENPSYINVEASHFDCSPDQEMEERCPHGCGLDIYRAEDRMGSWRAVEGFDDTYRQTRFCRIHGYARIYVTTGLEAVHAGYSINTL